ncbi:SDR family NAD(P)-dependent oxidoreductase [Nitrospirillum sp. BR 11164]|uniref:SDR family NAD(P)-dependent oxidoreductase n=1 Tax=Nitrospirillum sp. BR 11164 TaxID=3104324 RepID=UPI002AFF7EDA|nr:SDR family NAD(P)-dependent oxidoreductase [Nitrospirillum sp. BR 11164]MEA1652834.1 SDR family NAD(P)-dependent oxidoreductase [Nitrospirillum sp. BR 11164]
MTDGAETPFRIDGKVAVVTGAARGIGRSVAQIFAKAGASVVAADILADAAHETAGLVMAAGGQAIAATIDISDEASVKSLYDQAIDAFGGVDILIHSAAIFPKYPLLDMTVEQWDRIHTVNMRGSFLTVREGLRRMIAAGRGGAIVNVSSVSGERAVVFHNAAYNASKAGLTNLTRTSALEAGPHGIRVNAVLPGGTATEGAREATADMRARGLEIGGPITQPGRVPLGMMGQPEDIAHACLFLASPAARAITGQALAVDGGFLVS